MQDTKEKNVVNISQENNQELEFHINSYEIKELYSSAFELMKRSSLMISLIPLTLYLGYPMFLCLFGVILDLILGHLAIRYIFIFIICALLVVPWWIIIEYKGVFTLQQTTKNLSIKIINNKIIFSSESRYAIVDIKNIKIKEKRNGILLIFKRANNQKLSNLRNLITKIYFLYDCVPLFKSNLTDREIEQIRNIKN